jgi:S1-C subfamily serine protease
MRIFLSTFFAFLFLLVNCDCGGGVQRAAVPPLQEVEGMSEREQQRLRVDYMAERTVSVLRDCGPKEDVVIFGIDNPERELDGRGTGVIVNSREKRSYIFTAAHVVVPKKKYKAAFTCKVYVNINENLGKRDTRLKAEVLEYDRERDVAVLAVNKDLGVATEPETDPFVGEAVWAVGYPVQLASRRTKRLSITEGTLATLKVPCNDNVSSEGYYHRVTAQIYHGNSGGGVWTVEGKLVGIASALYTNGDGVPIEGYYYIKPVDEFVLLLKKTWKYWEVFNNE